MAKKRNRNKQKAASKPSDAVPATPTEILKAATDTKTGTQEAAKKTNSPITKSQSPAPARKHELLNLQQIEKMASLLAPIVPKRPSSPPKYISLHDLQERLHIYESRLLESHENCFSKKENVIATMKKAWRIFDLHKPHFCYAKYSNDNKSDTSADRHRKEGNKAFNEGQYGYAYKQYALGIQTAGAGTKLSTFYVNLSAVYFALKQYQSALESIENVRSMKDVKLSEETSEILKLRQEACLEALKPEIENKENTSENLNQKLDHHVTVKTKHAEHVKSWPKINDKLSVKEHHLSDRGVYADADVEPGEILIQERAYVSDLRMQSFVLNCYNCLKRLTTPIGCRQCSVVLFCDKKCEEESWNDGVHSLECEYFTSFLLATGFTQMAFKCAVKGLRAHPKFFKKGLVERKYQHRIDQFVEKSDENTSLSEPESKYGKILNMYYDFEHYKTVFRNADNFTSDINHNHESETANPENSENSNESWTKFKSDVFFAIVFADFLLENLSELKDLEMRREQVDVEFLAYIILMHSSQIKYNSVTLQTVQYDESYSMTSHKAYAVGVFPNIAFTNHSCAPNAAPAFFGDICYFYSTRNIKKDSQVLNCYGPIYTMESYGRNERRFELKQKYGFNCFCDACRYNYASENNRGNHFLRCPECDRCLDKYPECSNCDNIIDIHHAITKISHGIKERLSVNSYFGAGDYIGAIKQCRKACNTFEQVIGVPDYDVASCYFKFAVGIECILNNK